MAVTLRLRAKGDLLCADYDAHESGIKRFVGRKHSTAYGHEYRDEQGNLLKTGGWPSTGEPQELPYRAELAQAVREGDCWAADEATAAACGVTFDPTCGGELQEPEKLSDETQEALETTDHEEASRASDQH